MQQYSQFPPGTTQWPVRFCRHAPNIRATKTSSVVYRPLTRSLWAENILNCSKSRIDQLRKRQVRWTSTGVAYCTASLTIIADFKSTHRLLLAVILFFLCVFENHEKHWSRKIPKVFLQNSKPPIKKKKEKRERKSLQQDDNLKKHARIKNHTPDKLAFVIYII